MNLAKYFKALPRKNPLTLHSSKAYQKIFKLLKMVHWAKNNKADSQKSAFFIFKRIKRLYIRF
ncbi:hypothetical protein EUA42_20310 [Bacillus velezensis]|nr:hypothetical protein EUA42_20310 [Bacillus velezensis]